MVLDLSGLDDFQASSLMSEKPDLKNIVTGPGKMSYVLIEIIEPDPANARKNVDNNIAELVESIQSVSPISGKMRGIKSPLSLRTHPEKEGFYLVNSGHRRLRAAIIAGLREVPAFIDDEVDDYDRVIFNLQREKLSPLEIAYFIQKRVEAGDKKQDIAARLGKPPSFISDHMTFFNMPEKVRDLYDSNICNSIQALVMLNRASQKHPDETEQFCETIDKEKELSTAEVRDFLSQLDSEPTTNTKKKNSILIVVEHEGQEAILLLKESIKKQLACLQLEDGTVVTAGFDEIKPVSIRGAS